MQTLRTCINREKRKSELSTHSTRKTIVCSCRSDILSISRVMITVVIIKQLEALSDFYNKYIFMAVKKVAKKAVKKVAKKAVKKVAKKAVKKVAKKAVKKTAKRA